MPNKAFPPGKGIEDLEQEVRRVASSQLWNARVPLPTTREFGERYRISNASVCRLLKRLSEEKTIWRRENGRYYLNESRKLYERHKPYACLLRKLQNWSRIYQGIMNGFSQAFGSNRAAMLFVHDETLVRHTDIAHPPVHASAAEQRESLAEFFRNHDGQFAGILLDDIWLDGVLDEFSNRLTNAAIVCRPSRIAGISSVAPDFEAGALLAIGHLYARGYEEVLMAMPFTDAVPIDLMQHAAVMSATRLGTGIDPKNICSVATPEERERFLSRLKGSSKRVGVFCLEDNVALLLWKSFAKAGLECPKRVGLVSGMGTGIVADHRISSLKIDYERIGFTAGEILASGERRVVTLPTQLYLGTTT
jgi:hypothetical protein